jgi:uncharacterized membrane protein YfcA
MHRTETNMTDGIATDLYRAVAPSPRHGPMPVPTTTARITQAEGGGAVEQPIDGTSLLTRYSRSTRVGRASILILSGCTVWILTASVLLPHENLPAQSAIFIAAIVSSIAGFAFSALAGAMLLHVVPHAVEAVMIMMVCSIAIQSLSVALLWRDIDWRNMGVFLLGGITGLPIGVWLLLHLDAHLFKQAIGALLLAYAGYGFIKGRLPVHSGNRLIDTVVGLIGGVTGGLAGFPGAAITVWCGMRGWDKRRQRATYQPFILVMQVLGLLCIRILQPAALPVSALAVGVLQFVPVALVGAWAGIWIFERLSDRHFAIAVNVLLLVSGLGLLA